MTARLMKMSAVADTSFLETTRKPRACSSQQRRASVRRQSYRRPADEATPARRLTRRSPPPRLALPGRARLPPRRGSTAAVLSPRADDPIGPDAPAAVSAASLASFAGSHDGPVYWVGPMAARTLELTSPVHGTFVRYLPSSASVGDSERAITVGTYPMRNAYATAAARAKSTQMTSRETAPGRGLAVWSKTRPTSVYLAFPGVPHLVEVYAPDAGQARSLALSERIRPVS